MKKIAVLLAVMALGVVCGATHQGPVLFSDSFNRPDNTDIDASSVGMTGLLAPVVYMEAFEGSGSPTSIQILNNQLNIAVGAGMSSLFIDHNLIDNEIQAADGFVVSMDVVGITSADDQGNRFGGFGVGNSRDEALAAQDSYTSLVPFRPALHLAGRGVSDFYVDLALDQNLRLWSNGTLLEAINVGSAIGTIRVEFFVPDFNAGTVVMADVFFNGVKRSTQFFTWDHSNANYLGISGRTVGAGVFLDNLQIAVLYDDKANTPVPANGTIDVDPAAVVLQWNKGRDAAGNPNTNIAQHYLYIAEGEPNFLDVSPITVADAADPIVHIPASIGASDWDKVYYWRVDESVFINGTPSVPSEPNTIQGAVWSFETLKSVPIITASPTNQLANTGQTVDFSVSVFSISPVDYQWYKSADNSTQTPEDDVLVGDAETLTLSNVQAEHEGYYYCRVVNQSGEENARYTTVAQLGIARKVAHWTLDWDEFVGGVYLDSSGEEHHAEPNSVPSQASFVAGVDTGKTGQALDLTVQPLAAAYSGDWAPSSFTGEFSFSAWVKWAGPNGAWQGVVSNRVSPAEANFYCEIRQDNGNIQLGAPYFAAGDLQAGNLPVDQWTHLAVVAGEDGFVIYINGISVADRIPARTITQNVLPLYLGALGRSATTGTLTSPFNGIIDDVRIYNYAKDRYAIADLFYDILETPVCLNPDNVSLRFDVAGGGPNGDQPDCKVNLADFAVFAQNWLNCGLYPQFECD